MRKFVGYLLAAAVVVAPVAASANPASKLSIAQVRAASTTQGESRQIFGGGYLIPVIIVVAVGLGLYFALDDDDDDSVSA